MLTLEYDGTDFFGWSVQSEGRTVQGELERSLAQFLGHTARVDGSGRTDSGVHARGQVAAFTTTATRSADNILRGLNSLLPQDLAVVDAREVPLHFDPRHDAKVKQYRYTWYNRRIRSPLALRRAWWVRDPLNVEAMNRALVPLVGTHDFSSFRAAGCDAAHPIRTMQGLTVSRAGDEVFFDAFGHGFLRFMVRNLAGALWVVGLERRPPEWLYQVLMAKDRRAAPRTAPAQGLTLISVSYDESIPDYRSFTPENQGTQGA